MWIFGAASTILYEPTSFKIVSCPLIDRSSSKISNKKNIAWHRVGEVFRAGSASDVSKLRIDLTGSVSEQHLIAVSYHSVNVHNYLGLYSFARFAYQTCMHIDCAILPLTTMS